MELDNNNHSVFLLYYHLVLVVKYRCKVFSDKSVSSRLIKKDFSEVRHKLWKEMFWSRSYCLLTTGGFPSETIRKYIETQVKTSPLQKPITFPDVGTLLAMVLPILFVSDFEFSVNSICQSLVI